MYLIYYILYVKKKISHLVFFSGNLFQFGIFLKWMFYSATKAQRFENYSFQIKGYNSFPPDLPERERWRAGLSFVSWCLGGYPSRYK